MPLLRILIINKRLQRRPNEVLYLDVPRPGDFFDALSIISGYILLNSSKGKLVPSTVYVTKDSCFLDIDLLFKDLLLFNFIYISRSELDKINGIKVNIKSRIVNLFGTCRSFSYLYRLICHYYAKIENTQDVDIYPIKNEIYLFVTLETEKRRWLGQSENLIYAIEEIKRNNKKDIIIINQGMTQSLYSEVEFSTYKISQNEYEESILNSISKKVNCSYINLFGKNMHEKMFYVKNSDMAIVSAGTGSTLPGVFSVPTLSYGNLFLIGAMKDLGMLGINPNEVVMSAGCIKDLIEDEDVKFLDKDYTIESQLNSFKVKSLCFKESLHNVLKKVNGGGL